MNRTVPQESSSSLTLKALSAKSNPPWYLPRQRL